MCTCVHVHLYLLKMSENAKVKINVEYCGSCGHIKQFIQLAEQVRETVPDAIIIGTPGRQASFEVQINEELVYSKLQTMAFPDFNEVTDVIRDVSQGKPAVKIKKQQPINCVIS